MWAAMVLAAGKGTRLAPLTSELPKPLVPIGDRPALAHVLERLAASGAERAVANVFHLPERFGPEVLAALPIPAELVVERELLGTAGGVRNAAAALGDGIVVAWNADVLAAGIDVRPLVERAATGGGRVADVALAISPRPRGEGTVGMSASGDVVRLRGETFGEEVRGGDFLGIQAIGPETRRRLPERGCLVGDVYLPALRAGAALPAVTFDVEWQDIGDPSAYHAANLRWLEARALSAWIAPGARIDTGVHVTRSLVGRGATVEGEGGLREVVVWPGARARAPLERCIVTTSGRVVAIAP